LELQVPVLPVLAAELFGPGAGLIPWLPAPQGEG
jgi:hypothetical protein